MKIWPLYASIQERRRPEDVARLCLDLGEWQGKTRRALEVAARVLIGGAATSVGVL